MDAPCRSHLRAPPAECCDRRRRAAGGGDRAAPPRLRSPRGGDGRPPAWLHGAGQRQRQRPWSARAASPGIDASADGGNGIGAQSEVGSLVMPRQVVDMDDFESYRPLLFAIAYRMLGSASDAEDIVHEAYLRYQSTPAGEIRTPKAYLSTIVTRLCLDELKSARAAREEYIGPWLPEPLLTSTPSLPPLQTVEQRESISM